MLSRTPVSSSSRHIELKIERNEFERTLFQFAKIADGHDEIKAVNGDALPVAFFDFVSQPFPRNFRPDLLFDPSSFFVADPTGFAGEDEDGITGKRNEHVNVAMNDFEI